MQGILRQGNILRSLAFQRSYICQERPVSNAAREGLHTLAGMKKSVLRNRPAARASRCGVSTPVGPQQLMSPYPRSSAKMTTKLGGCSAALANGHVTKSRTSGQENGGRKMTDRTVRDFPAPIFLPSGNSIFFTRVLRTLDARTRHICRTTVRYVRSLRVCDRIQSYFDLWPDCITRHEKFHTTGQVQWSSILAIDFC